MPSSSSEKKKTDETITTIGNFLHAFKPSTISCVPNAFMLPPLVFYNGRIKVNFLEIFLGGYLFA